MNIDDRKLDTSEIKGTRDFFWRIGPKKEKVNTKESIFYYDTISKDTYKAIMLFYDNLLKSIMLDIKKNKSLVKNTNIIYKNTYKNISSMESFEFRDEAANTIRGGYGTDQRTRPLEVVLKPTASISNAKQAIDDLFMIIETNSTIHTNKYNYKKDILSAHKLVNKYNPISIGIILGDHKYIYAMISFYGDISINKFYTTFTVYGKNYEK